MSRRRRVGVLLAPGAGADRDQATLVALDSALTSPTTEVVRLDFPYRRAGRRAPDRTPVLLAAVEEEAASLGRRCDRLILGGRSMGGRMCSMSSHLPSVAGLLLVSYPLHPPGKPDRMRTEHFPSISVPTLFISGTRDTFGTPQELSAATAAIPGPVTHEWIEGKDHGLRGVDAQVCSLVLNWLSGLSTEPAGHAP